MKDELLIAGVVIGWEYWAVHGQRGQRFSVLRRKSGCQFEAIGVTHGATVAGHIARVSYITTT